jgi:GNAT superfamily N-acetyltransferase
MTYRVFMLNAPRWEVEFRLATTDDVAAIERLIAESARALSRDDYTEVQIEAALKGAWGLDTQLLQDQTYFVAEREGILVACGGWSWRGTLFGGDAQPGRIAAPLDPAHDSARIRAFFVHPEYARQGLGRRLLELCERAARAYGFRSAQLVATLPGVQLYSSYGYVSDGPRDYPLGGGASISFVPMHKSELSGSAP